METRVPGCRRAWLAASALLLLSAAAPAAAQPARANATVKAKVVKPLVLSWVQDLNFGTVLLSGSGTWSGATATVNRSGIRTCSAALTCSGAFQVAKYRIGGTNNQTVRINAPNVTLVNQADASKTLTMMVDSPGSILLTNSSPNGQEFSLGGSINFSSTTADGTYVGTFNVTVEYQ